MSGWVVLFAGVLALCALIGTSTLLRPAGHLSPNREGARTSFIRILRRQVTAFIALCITTSLMCTTFALLANRTMSFLRTPSEVVGLVKNALGAGDTRVSAFAPPRQGEQDQRVDPPELAYDAQLHVWRGTLSGAQSGLTREVAVWAPPGYAPVGAIPTASQSDSADTPIPLSRAIVLYHGYVGTAIGTVQSLELTERIAPLVERGEIPPTLLIFPDLSMGGAEPDCVDVDGHPKTETFVVTDLVPAIRAAFPSIPYDPDHWAVGGFSSGAYCAPVIHVRHRDVFGTAVAMGGYDTPELGALKNADQATRDAFTISHLLAQPHDVPLRVLAMGVYADRDAMTFGTALQKLARTQPNDTFVSVMKSEGAHGWTTWREDLPSALKWWSGREVQSDAPTAPPWWQITQTVPLIGSFSAWGIAMATSLMRVRMRMRTGRVRRAVTDFFLAALTCILGALVALLLVNNSEVFFYSWDDLWTNFLNFLH